MKTKLTAALSAAIALAGLLGCATPERTSQKDTNQCIVKDGKVFDAAGNVMVGCVARFDGAMMAMTDRQLVPMKKNMRMSNGTVCVVDGTCIMKDGSRRKLKEGEVMDREGKLFHIKGAKVPVKSNS
jgi:Domain of unknown function (DUF6799)